MPDATKISVRALALGGKFIGQHVGFARIDIYGPKSSSKPLASGLTNQGLIKNTDGSGVTALIMNQPHRRSPRTHALTKKIVRWFNLLR